MAKRLTKKAIFLSSLVLFGFFGLVQSIIADNFSKSKSSFQREDISSFPKLIETAEADIPVPYSGDGDGDGDGSNNL